MDRLKVGVIGAGVLGCYHIEKCLSNPLISLAGFYDVSAGQRALVAQRFGIAAFDNLELLLPQVQALIIATPGSTHREVAQQCLEAGKHLLVEKPLATTYSDGLALVDAAESGKLILHVGHSEAFNPAYRKLETCRPLPRFMEIHRLAAFSGRGTDVSVIVDLMVHDLHLALRLCNEEPVADQIAVTGVAVVSGDIDIANARITFPSGCVANVTASRISTTKMRKFRVFQKDAYFSIDLDKREFVHCFLNPGPLTTANPVGMIKEVLPATDALSAEQEAFFSCIRKKPGGGETTGKEALAVLRTTDAIMRRLANQHPGNC